MSRYGDDGYDDEPFPNAWALYQHNAVLALRGKRGRKALAELREALLALPEKRLIASALCTVGPQERRPKPSRDGWDYPGVEFDELVSDQGEGVCAIGAYVWWKKVKGGVDPQQAFSELPTIPDFDSDGLHDTAKLATNEANMAYPLAWQIAYKNDETFEDCTPEQRYEKFLAWIDQELASDLVGSS